MSGIARQAMTTNLDPFVRLLGLVEVHLRLPVAAKHVLILQTFTKIICASERGRQNRKKKPIAKDEKEPLTNPTTPVPCRSSPSRWRVCILQFVDWLPSGAHLPSLVVPMSCWSSASGCGRGILC